MEFHDGCFCFRADEAEEARRSGLQVRCAPGLPCACIVLHDLATAAEADPLFDPNELIDTESSTSKHTSITSDIPFRPTSYSCPCMTLHALDAKRKKCCGDDCTCDAGDCACETAVKCCTPEDLDLSIRPPSVLVPALPPASDSCCNKSADSLPSGMPPSTESCHYKPPLVKVPSLPPRSHSSTKSAAPAPSPPRPTQRSLLGSLPTIQTTVLLHGVGNPSVMTSQATNSSTTGTTASSKPQSLLSFAPDPIPASSAAGSTAAGTTATTTLIPALPPVSTGTVSHSSLAHSQCQSHSLSRTSLDSISVSRELPLIAPPNPLSAPVLSLSTLGTPKREQTTLQQYTRQSTTAPRVTPSNCRKRNLVALFHCNDCDATFSTRDASETHAARVHGRNRPYACDKCGAKFLFKQNRDRHIVEVHHGARPHACPREGCSATFKNSSALKQHLRTVHEKQRPFKCQLCPSSFGQRNHLSQHVLVVHERRKLFRCDTCGTSFSNRGNLNQHVRRKHTPKPPPPPPTSATSVPVVVSTVASTGIPTVSTPPPEVVTE